MAGYQNVVLTVTKQATPDPYIIRVRDCFYFTFTTGNRIELWVFSNLLDIEHDASKHVIWRPPLDTSYSGGIWAPELHSLDGRWYMYFAAEHPAKGNFSHRMYVLGGPPATSCPCTGGTWEFLGPLGGMPSSQWAIDGTVIQINESHYFIYSGWPLGNPGSRNELMQELFITKMQSPTQVVDMRKQLPIRISTPERKWEWSGNHGINEGPQALVSPDGRWVGIAYSCAGSWTKDYKMATLQYLGGDPLRAASWKKSAEPLLKTSPTGSGPWGPGHGSFVELNGELVLMFHATDLPWDGWNNRKARLQRTHFSSDGPTMGGIVGPLVRDSETFLAPESHQSTVMVD